LILRCTIDLGRLVSAHDRNWTALTRSRHAGVVETMPYDIGSDESITKQLYRTKNWSRMKEDPESPVLPLLD